MTPQDIFINRLRRQRERNRISLDEIVGETRIRRDQLEAFERGDLTLWPRGIYARGWIRGYATIVGLDPNDTVDEFCRLFPQGDRRSEGTIRNFAAIVAHASTYQDEFAHVTDTDRRRATLVEVEVAPQPPTWRDHVLRAVQRLRNLRNPRART